MINKILHLKRAARAVLLVLLLSAVGMTKANPVDLQKAREVGAKFMNANSKILLRGTDDLQLVRTYSIDRGDAALYIFNLPNGFVIVSADDCATPILGYSDEGQFDMNNVPIQMEKWLQNFVAQIQYGIENQIADDIIAKQWISVMTDDTIAENHNRTSVNPLLSTNWDQDYPYNYYCPPAQGGPQGRAYAGSIATAMAMIMKYWNWPEHGSGSHSYTPSGYPTQTADFENEYYAWDVMPNTCNSYHYSSVAILIYHCGVSVDMQYGGYGSFASPLNVSNALTNYFRYSSDLYGAYRSDYNDSTWLDMLKNCLNLGRPVFYSGDDGYSEHSFVCDGYNSNDMLHFNWGWNGFNNNYFAIGALNTVSGSFNNNNYAIFDIHPAMPVVTVSCNPTEGGSVTGAGTYGQSQTCTLTATANDGYTFINWTENGVVISTENPYSFSVSGDRNLVANFSNDTIAGILNGQFSVSANMQVFFSQGNLQYQATTDTWRFSANQYDYIGTDNVNISQTYSGWIDLFGWGTSGYDHGAVCYQPWSTSLEDSDYYAYNSNSSNLYDGTGQADWGANPILNGGNIPNQWRTLKSEEWQYLFNTRPGIRYAKAVVNDVCGVILLPDGWNEACHYLAYPNEGSVPYTSNVISADDWAVMETAGAVFLPASGIRNGNTVNDVGYYTGYWSSTRHDSNYNCACCVNLYHDYVNPDSFYYLNHGYPVRLVRNTQYYTAIINATTLPAEGGTVSGGGNYQVGTTCTLTATANQGYIFTNWTKDGISISTNPTYTFTVTGDASFVANFELPFPNIYADEQFMIEGNDNYINWDALTESTPNYYNVYRDGTLVSSTTDTHYYCGDLTYNHEGYLFHVTAVYDIGESIPSNQVWIYVSGEGTIAGHVYEQDSVTPVQDAMIRFDGIGELGGSYWYYWYPGYDGYYSFSLVAGTYTAYAIAPGYQKTQYLGQINISYGQTTYNIDFLMDELFKPITQVDADYYPEANNVNSQAIKVSWAADDIDHYDFDNYTFQGWTTIDADGDGFNWMPGSDLLGTDCGRNASNDCVLSQSYSISSGILYPDNYLVSPQIQLGGQLTFYACAQDANYAAEHFGVAVSTSGNTIASDFNTIQEWTMTAKGSGQPTEFTRNGSRAKGNWYQYTVDLSAYSGPGYVAIRHFNCSDMFYLDVDDISIIEPVTSSRTFQHYRVYRTDESNNEPFNIENTVLVADNVSNTYFIDESWAGLEEGSYKYGVSRVYEGNRESAISWGNTTSEGNDAMHGSLLVQNDADWCGSSSQTVEGCRNQWDLLGEVVPSIQGERESAITWSNPIEKNNQPSNYHWEVNPLLYPNTLTMIGIVEINEVEQMTTMLEVGAFCGDECRGRERSVDTYYQAFGHYFVFLTVYGDSESADEITFRLYDHALGEEVDKTCVTTLTFEADAIYGSNANPFVFNFIDDNVTQASNLSSGWNWRSSYIELDDNSLQSLQEGLGTSGEMIKSQNDGYASYLDGYGWYGSLASINNESTYQVKTNAACSIELTGSLANPEDHPITLNNGWTWVGYPVNANLSVTEALSGITSQTNDMLKSQNDGFASYLEGFGWYGSLNLLHPGMGLMYKSNNNSNITLTYPNSGTKTDLRANQTTENNHWRPNLNTYPDNMSVMAVVELNGEEVQGEQYELAVFAGGECRGSARLLYVEPINRYMAFLTVAGDEAAELYFALYNTETGEVETQCITSLLYETNAVIGSFDDPYIVRFRHNTGLDEWDNFVNLFPNPVARGQRVSLGLPAEETSEVRVEIINALGAIVETRRATSLQTITAPSTPGVYTLRISVEGKGTCYRKLVVE